VCLRHTVAVGSKLPGRRRMTSQDEAPRVASRPSIGEARGAVGQFAVAALYERRKLLKQKPAVIGPRHKRAELTPYRPGKRYGVRPEYDREVTRTTPSTNVSPATNSSMSVPPPAGRKGATWMALGLALVAIVVMLAGAIYMARQGWLSALGRSLPGGSRGREGSAQAASVFNLEGLSPDEKTARRKQLADYMEKLYQVMDGAAQDIQREDFDAQAMVDKVGKDPQKLFEWVRDNTWWVPYRGALRGPTGVLMDRVGNSLDRSLLLAELLRLAGHSARLARARRNCCRASTPCWSTPGGRV